MESGESSLRPLTLPPTHTPTHNDLPLDAQVGLLEQPDLDPGPGLEEPEDQVLCVCEKKRGGGEQRVGVVGVLFYPPSLLTHQLTIGWVMIRLTRGCWASMLAAGTHTRERGQRGVDAGGGVGAERGR